ncbi:hypothetical protein [Devosia sp. MC1541]|uniref:hypothetical protein n=1 Tax=Devosia sp. MC1541 TaxID=2725264 RepID=UPI00145EC314|nr:hypothetical protein [Devosia sp. MC1541]
MSLKALAIATVATVAFTSTAAFAESHFSKDEVFGRSTYATTVLLAEQGINATSVEAWGEVIRVEAAGSTKLIFVDKDTLRPVTR